MSGGTKGVLVLLLLAAAGAAAYLILRGGAGPTSEVVVYTSADAAYSRPVADAFEKQSGIRVLLVPIPSARGSNAKAWRAGRARRRS